MTAGCMKATTTLPPLPQLPDLSQPSRANAALALTAHRFMHVISPASSIASEWRYVAHAAPARPHRRRFFTRRQGEVRTSA